MKLNCSCSTQLSIRFQLLILAEMLKNIDFLALKLSDVVFILLIKFMRRIHFMLSGVSMKNVL